MLSGWMIAAALVGCSRPQEPPKPDRVLILVDTLRADAPHYAGNELPTTPNIDALAAESAWFSRAYSPSTWTLPAVASILTGLYPWQSRVVHDVQQRDSFGRLSASIPTLAAELAAQGYRTGAFVNNAFMAPAFGLGRGFEHYDYEGADLVDHRTAAETVRRALDWLAADERPAFLLVHVMEPHADYQPSPPYAGSFSRELPHTLSLPLGNEMVDALILGTTIPSPEDQAYIHRAYLEEVRTVDAALGALFQGLKARPAWAESTVVFTSDHGEEFWEFGGYEHGHICNSVVTQVPLVVRAPQVKPGENRSVVSLVDLFPLFVHDGGEIARLARSGASEEGRIAFSEDTLYTEQQVSAVTDDLRMTVALERQEAWYYRVAPGVEELSKSADPEIQAARAALQERLLQARGSLDPTVPAEVIDIPDDGTFDQLRALGYVQ